MMKPPALATALLALLPVDATPLARDPKVVALVDAVSAARIEKTILSLAAFNTRSTTSNPDPATNGIGAAREWIRAEMAKSPRLQTSFDSYRIPPTGDRITKEIELVNVMAVLPGKSARRVYVSGHYDSLARAPQTQGFNFTSTDNRAPGANDDGSGTALTMELARAFAESGLEFDATIVFIALAGEEQGLVGAKLHAQKAAAEKTRIDAVLNNDIIGGSRGGNGALDSSSLRVFSEGPEDSLSRQLARFIQRQAATYVPHHRVRLIARHDRFGRGGDHTSFNAHGFAAVRFSESKENYSKQHTVDDTPDGVDFAYLANNARVNAAALAVLALAPAAPEVTEGRGPTLGRGKSGYDASLRWKASSGATAYRVFWREAWTPDWQHEATVEGNATEFVLPNVSIDDYVFGVAAVGPGGHESLVSAYVNPPRPMQEIKTLPR